MGLSSDSVLTPMRRSSKKASPSSDSRPCDVLAARRKIGQVPRRAPMNPQANTKPKAREKAAANPLACLHDYGQAPWLDFLARRFIAEGGLKKLVERDGLTGVTSNPSIFEKAIAGSADYDSSLREIEAEGDVDVMTLYERLAIADIQSAADVLRPVFEATKGADGYVSLEVSPYLAMSTEGTVAEAKRLCEAGGRHNG